MPLMWLKLKHDLSFGLDVSHFKGTSERRDPQRQAVLRFGGLAAPVESGPSRWKCFKWPRAISPLSAGSRLPCLRGCFDLTGPTDKALALDSRGSSPPYGAFGRPRATDA